VSEPTATQLGAGRTVSRRGFVALMGGSIGAASLLSACGDSSASAETSEFGSGDAGIINYLLTLEYTLANFYKQLKSSTLFSAAERNALAKFGEQEEEHAAALVRQVEKAGGEPVGQPQAKFSLKTGPGTLEVANKLENTIAGAYLGQLPQVESDSLRQKLLEIHSVEGKHAASIAYLQKKPVTPDGAFAKPSTVVAVMAAMKPYLGASSGSA
jgi:ferritin-like protein